MFVHLKTIYIYPELKVQWVRCSRMLFLEILDRIKHFLSYSDLDLHTPHLWFFYCIFASIRTQKNKKKLGVKKLPQADPLHAYNCPILALGDKMQILGCPRAYKRGLFLKFSVAKATLESQMSVCPSICPSVRLSQKPLSLSELLQSTIKPIEPIDHQAYRPSNLSTIKSIDHRIYRPSNLSTIEPIDHQAYQPPSLSTIKSINHQAYWPSSLLTIKPLTIKPIDLSSSFATFKPFGLLFI